jgi:LAO/AO transport system kinase
MATRGHRGGLALAVPGAVRVLDAAGFDPVVVETTGVGQVEVDIVGAADTTVLVVAAGWGDAVQASKAGLLEVADLFVVNKADRHGAHDARRDLDLMLDLGRVSGHEDRRGHRPEIVMTTSTTGHGVEGVASAIDEHRRHLVESGERARAYHRRIALEVRDRAQALLVTRVAKLLSSEDGRVALDAAERRAMTPAAAARAVAARIIAAPDRTSPEHDRS